MPEPSWLQRLVDGWRPRGCTAAVCTTCWGSEGERLFSAWIEEHTSPDPALRAAQLAQALRTLRVPADLRQRELLADLCDHLMVERPSRVEPPVLTRELKADPAVRAAVHDLKRQVGSGSGAYWDLWDDEDEA